jgi:tetrahydromethanopterin S-methyltransferase subunit F
VAILIDGPNGLKNLRHFLLQLRDGLIARHILDEQRVARNVEVGLEVGHGISLLAPGFVLSLVLVQHEIAAA